MLLQSLVNLSVDDFESTSAYVSEQFTQRRAWIEELDDKLAMVEDTRVDRVCLIICLSILIVFCCHHSHFSLCRLLC